MKKYIKISLVFILFFQALLLHAQNKKAWTAITVPMKQTSQLYFWSEDSGYAVDKTVFSIYKTVDGGKNWVLLKAFDSIANWSNTFGDYSFYDKNTIYVCGSNNNHTQGYPLYLFKTYDGGVTWTTIINNIQDKPKKLYYFGKDTLVLGRDWGSNSIEILKFSVSFDGGATFTTLPEDYTGAVTVFRMGEKILFKGVYGCSESPNRWCSKLLICKNWDSVLAAKYVKFYNISTELEGVVRKNDSTLMFYLLKSIGGGFIFTTDQCNSFTSLPFTDPLYEEFVSKRSVFYKDFKKDFLLPVDVNNNNLLSSILYPSRFSLSYYSKVLQKEFFDTSGYGKQTDSAGLLIDKGLKNLCVNFVNDSIAYIGTDSNTILKTTTGGGIEELYSNIAKNGIKTRPGISYTDYTLFPNPAQNKILVSGYPIKQVNSQYSIYSMDGKLLLQGTLLSSQTSINTSSLSNGMYLFKTHEGYSKFIILK